jgi:hypothetical protein
MAARYSPFVRVSPRLVRAPTARAPAVVQRALASPRAGAVRRGVKHDVRDDSGHLIRELHGVNLASIVEYLVARVGWAAMAAEIPINCFAVDPSVKSSLTFLRRTPWARAKVEQLYIELRTEEVLAARRG